MMMTMTQMRSILWKLEEEFILLSTLWIQELLLEIPYCI